MPPWHVNPHIGIQEFKNDRGLTSDEIATIVQWVDSGSPEVTRPTCRHPSSFPRERTT